MKKEVWESSGLISSMGFGEEGDSMMGTDQQLPTSLKNFFVS
jgi:hypothetical protein